VNIERISLLDESAFATGGGLWIGKKGPFVSATVIRNTNFTASGHVDYSDVAVLQVEEKQLARRRLIPRDIIIERSGGGPSQPVGRVVFFDRHDGVFSHSNFTSRLRVLDTDRFEPRFVFYFLLYFHDSGQTDDLQRRTTGIRNLDWRAYREAAGVPLFDLDEQRQIVALLSAMQRAVERHDWLIALTAELKKALMHKLFTEGPNVEPLKRTEIGLIPASWTLKYVADLGTCVTGTTPSTKIDDYYSNPAYCFVSPADLGKTKYIATSEKQVSKAGLTVARVLPRDSVLCVCIGSTIGKTGMTWHKESCTNQQINAIIADAPTNPHFVYYLLTYWSNHWKSHATFGPVPILSKGAFEKVRIPFTRDRNAQDRIAEILSAADVKIEHHLRHRESLAMLFRTLLQQLMTAQIRVHDLDLSALEEAQQESVGAA